MRSNKLITFKFGLLFAVGIGLRFVNLGYSNFQGDEISAICHPSHFDTWIKFLGYLLGQQKGPVQYVISCAYGLFDPAFSSEFGLRLPYALASTLALVCFTVVAWSLFGRLAAVAAGFSACDKRNLCRPSPFRPIPVLCPARSNCLLDGHASRRPL